jgi:hypothetical protein
MHKQDTPEPTWYTGMSGTTSHLGRITLWPGVTLCMSNVVERCEENDVLYFSLKREDIQLSFGPLVGCKY